MAPPDDKKFPGGKAPAKAEAINLKVFIHCEGCKKKVKRILRQIEGVETVDIDASLGKVTVTGIVDPKVLLKKLEKAGKVAEVLNTSGGKGKEQQKDQSKAEKKEPKKVRFEEVEGDKKGKGGGGESADGGGGKKGNKSGNTKGTAGGDGGENANGEGAKKGPHSGTANTEENGKKKKGGDVGFDEAGPSKTTGHKNVAPLMIETGYSVESADYATHIFSDENTDSCCIM